MKFGRIIGYTLVVLIALGIYKLYRFYDYSCESPYLATLPSPDRSKTAYLLKHGALMGRTISLFTSTPDTNNPVRWIGFVDSDDRIHLGELVWSGDSSLIAARCYVRSDWLPQGTDNTCLFTHGYDFTADEHVTDATPESWIDRDHRIKQLFTGKFGETPCYSGDAFYEHMNKLTWREWRQWKKRLQKIESQQWGAGSPS